MDGSPEMSTAAVVIAYGDACATLTPMIKNALHGLASGSVMEVRSDDPSAREAVPAWARLTGNSLIDVVEDDDEHTRFFIRKK